MKQLTLQVKISVLELYLKGLSTNEIVTELGISKGAVVSIIKDAREGQFPQLELGDRINELHSLSVRLKKESLDLIEAKLGFDLLKRLWDIGVEPEKLAEWAEFCSHISPDPPNGFIPAAMEAHRIQKDSGMTYSELASQAKELSQKRDNLLKEVGDLQAKERRARELRLELEGSEKSVKELRIEKEQLAREVSNLKSYLHKKAEELGIPFTEFEVKLSELFTLGEELDGRSKEKKKLEGQIEALTQREQKLSSQMEKASTDFKNDLTLLKGFSAEIAKIATMKGQYEKELEHMEWGKRILPFLSDPEKIKDDDLSLACIVVNCLDRWIQNQPEWHSRFYSRTPTWDEVKKHVLSKRK